MDYDNRNTVHMIAERSVGIAKHFVNRGRQLSLATGLLFGGVEVSHLIGLADWWQVIIGGVLATVFLISDEGRALRSPLVIETVADSQEISAPLKLLSYDKMILEVFIGIEAKVRLEDLGPIMASLDRLVRITANPDDPAKVVVEFLSVEAGSVKCTIAIVSLGLAATGAHYARASYIHDLQRAAIEDARLREQVTRANRGCNVEVRIKAGEEAVSATVTPPLESPPTDGQYWRGTVTFAVFGGSYHIALDAGQTDGESTEIPVTDRRLYGEMLIRGEPYEVYGRISRGDDGQAQAFELLMATRL